MTDRVLQFGPHRDVTHCISQVCQALTAGVVVGLPTETAYLPVCLTDFATRLRELTQLSPEYQLVMLMHDAQPIVDASQSSRMHRLIRRGWPGPIVLDLPVDPHSRSTVESLGMATALDNDRLRATMTVSRVIEEVLSRLGRPLVSLMKFTSPMASSAGELQEEWGDRIGLLVEAGPPRFLPPPTMVRVSPDCLSILASGLIGEEMVHRMSAKVFLFVCTGNTCRSPMAEGLFRHLLADELGCTTDELIKSGRLVLSAGLAAAHGMPASEESISLLKQRGIDIVGHFSQPVTHELLQHSDHVFTMTARHREQILRTYPELTDQVQMLSPQGKDIVDPIGGTWEDYSDCLQQIERALRDRLQRGLGRED